MIEFRNLTRKRIRTKIFHKLGNKIIPQKFELSVVFAAPLLMRRLNKRYRRKDKIADTLSFLLEKRKGEIFVNAADPKLPYLFVHSALHLLGFNHKRSPDAKKMESKELNILKSQ